MAEVEAMERVLADSQRRLWYLQSPLAPRRLFRWFTVSGPKVLAVLVLLTGLWWLTRFVGKKIVAEFVRRSRRGRSAEREQRAETLRRVFQNAAGLALLVIGGLAVLQLSGIDITVLLGGAAVLGAALAFGSQNLIKDYFAGFMILVENQYSVGNVVKIADISGSVEDITLRTTVLRDEEGSVHFIPHNQVTRVTNLTYGWSRVVLKVPISYRDDLAKVMELMVDIARELRDDSKYGPAILGEPDMQGIDSFDERGVTIKLLIMTRPLKQWEIKREYYKRMFDRFAQKGIEIPVPPQRLQISADEQREKIYSGTAQALR